MGKEVEQAVKDAVANVACEVGEVSKETLVKIREQLSGDTIKSDNSFIYSLYEDVLQGVEKDDENGHSRKI